MLLRKHVDGALVAAKLMLDRSSAGGRRFLLTTRGKSGEQAFVGPVCAAMGYEIVRMSPRERVELLLAGFGLREAGQNASAIHCLAALLRRERERKPAQVVPESNGVNVRRDPPATPGRTAHRKSRARSPGESSAAPN